MKRGLRLAIPCLLALLCSTSGSAQQSMPGGRVRGLNNQLLQVLAQLQSNPGTGNGLRAQADALFRERAGALASLIQQNPGEAFRLALPVDVLSDLATSFPGTKSQLESHGKWDGPIEYFIEDSEDFKSHRNIRTISADGETLYVQFTGDEPVGLKNGDVLHVEGVRAGNQVAADSASSTIIRTARSAPSKGLTCSTLGPQKSIVLLVTMPGSSLPTDVSRAGVWDAFFNTTGSILSLTDFWRENSYGMTIAVGDVANGPNGGWYTLDRVYTEAQLPQIRAAAIAAADADVNFTQYTRLFIVINGMAVDSDSAGWGTIGCGSLSSADGGFNASTAWMRATSLTDSDNLRAAHIAIHEAGHNLGLQHSNSRDFGAEALGAQDAAGVVDDYGDSFAAMGRGFGHYAAPHKAMLGWFPTQVQTIATSGTYTVQPTEVGGNIQALKIRRGIDNADWLWVEYRKPIGKYDSKLSAPFVAGLAPNQISYLDAGVSHIYSGGLIHYEDVTTGAYSHLIDFTPQSILTNTSPLVADDWLDPPLVGTWTDPYTGLSITTSNPTGSALTVNVVYGPAPCIAVNPGVTISPSNPSAKRGQNVTFTVSVKNNDASTCPSKSFSLASSLPSGWTSSISPAVITVSPQTSDSASMTKTVPADSAYATYAVEASAFNGINSGTGMANVTVKVGK